MQFIILKTLPATLRGRTKPSRFLLRSEFRGLQATMTRRLPLIASTADADPKTRIRRRCHTSRMSGPVPMCHGKHGAEGIGPTLRSVSYTCSARRRARQEVRLFLARFKTSPARITPASNIIKESSCPMLSGPAINPSCASGSRVNSSRNRRMA